MFQKNGLRGSLFYSKVTSLMASNCTNNKHTGICQVFLLQVQNNCLVKHLPVTAFENEILIQINGTFERIFTSIKVVLVTFLKLT